MNSFQTDNLKDTILSKISKMRDPEIPTISILDLGIIKDIRIEDKVIIEIKKTYSGCVALDLIKLSIENYLKELGIKNFEVRWVHSPPWRSSDISEEGKKALKKAGICPPDEEQCPYCNSRNVRLESEFGPTRCRAIYYCNDCKNPFEKFK